MSLLPLTVKIVLELLGRIIQYSRKRSERHTDWKKKKKKSTIMSIGRYDLIYRKS